MDGIVNQQVEIEVVPGEESRHILSHPSYPLWGDDCPMILLAPQVNLRLPAYAEGRDIIIELNSLDSIFPPLSTGFCLSAYFGGRMVRVASGYLRRK